MITIYSAREFYTQYYTELLENEAVHQLMISNLNRVISTPEEGVLFAVCEREHRYFICNYPPFAMLVTRSGKSSDEEEMRVGEEIAMYVREQGIKITGISASKGIVDGFLLHNKNMYLSESMDIMVLTEVNRLKDLGVLQYASSEHIEELATMYIDFALEALGDAPGRELALDKIRTCVERNDAYILLDEGRIVSMCMTPRHVEKGKCISAVYTKPKYRGMGYCKSMISRVCERLLQQGDKFVTLYVDTMNPISNDAYRAVGFRVVESCYKYEYKEKTV
ncbi:MAG: GNAT family N-acetyltransferase [Erysipelotrichales bacterium]|nr:GNAT family N-acetyltransferase [Erysipelotrichales bacterium]